MKQRLLNVIKIFLMILGGLFLIQLLIILGAIIGLASFANSDLSFLKQDDKLKLMQPIIDYAEKYNNENGKYPDKIENVKLKKDLEYKYETSKDSNCYTIILKSKKQNLTQQYQRCSSQNDYSTSNSQSYVEYSE